MSEVIYPPCKYCGKSHGMGVEDMETGKIEPIVRFTRFLP